MNCKVLRVFLLSMCVLTAIHVHARQKKEKPTNVIFILVDDMGWADLGCYGSTSVKTPHIDKLAKDGMRFTDAYAGHTVCAPSRCVLMTGMHTGHSTIRANSGTASIRDEDVTVAEIFKQAGYTTGGFGKWGLGTMQSPGAAENQGFDTFFGYYDQVHAHTYYPSFLVEDGRPFVLPNNAKANGYKHGVTPLNPRSERSKIYRTDKKMSPKNGAVAETDREFSHYLIFERTKQFIRENKEKPFFCYAPWTPPHAAYHIPESDPAWQMYKDKPWSLEAKAHAAFVSMADYEVGQIVDLLEELGIRKNTAIFFMSDNGASHRFEGELNSSGPLKGKKRSMHDGGLRSPLIVSWPEKVNTGSVSNIPTYTADFMPTVAEIIGAQKFVPNNVDGISILPTLLGKDKKQKQHDCMYWEWPNGKGGSLPQAVRCGNWKLVRMANEDPWQLYNLKDDLGESNNIAEQYPELIEHVNKWLEKNRTKQ